MEPKLETPHEIHSAHEFTVADSESPPENQNERSRDSGDNPMRKLGIRRISSEAPKRSNKRGRPRGSKDAMVSPVIIGLLASERIGAGSPSMEDSSGDDDDGTFQRHGPRVRKIKWTEHLIGVFLELLDRELAAYSYMQNMPHADGKMRIVRDFKVRTGIELPWDSFKHKYDNLRRLYIAWGKLAASTDVSVDSVTGHITMDEQWWKDRESEVPLSKTLHRHPISHMELMHRVFKHHSIRRNNPNPFPPNTPALHTVVVTDAEPCNTVPAATHEDHVVHSHEPHLPFASPVAMCEPSLSEDQTSSESPITPSSSLAPPPVRTYREQPRHAPYPVANRKVSPRSGIPSSRRCPSRRRTASEAMGYQRSLLVTFKEAFSVLNKLEMAKFTDFWWASVRILKEDVEWRESFLEFSTDGEKIAFLEGLTGYDRHNNYVGLKGLQAFAGSSNCVNTSAN